MYFNISFMSVKHKNCWKWHVLLLAWKHLFYFSAQIFPSFVVGVKVLHSVGTEVVMVGIVEKKQQLFSCTDSWHFFLSHLNWVHCPLTESGSLKANTKIFGAGITCIQWYKHFYYEWSCVFYKDNSPIHGD